MKKIFLITYCSIIKFIFSTALKLIMFIALSVLWSKYIEFPRDLTELLQSKYNENMSIGEISLGEMGWYAYVSTEEVPDLNFLARGLHDDFYLERILAYEVENKIEQHFPKSRCSAEMTGATSISTVNDVLYDMYIQLGRPAVWDEIPDYMCLAKIFVSFPEMKETDADEVMNIIKRYDFRAFNVYIRDISKGIDYHFIYDSSGDYIKGE